jgi:uncharacterized protein
MRVRTWLLMATTAAAYALPCAAMTDCSKPKTKIDWMLCSSERATMEEQRMARAFRDAANRVEDRRKLLDDQKEWTIKVRDECNEIACLLKAYQERTEELETY